MLAALSEYDGERLFGACLDCCFDEHPHLDLQVDLRCDNGHLVPFITDQIFGF